MERKFVGATCTVMPWRPRERTVAKKLLVSSPRTSALPDVTSYPRSAATRPLGGFPGQAEGRSDRSSYTRRVMPWRQRRRHPCHTIRTTTELHQQGSQIAGKGRKESLLISLGAYISSR